MKFREELCFVQGHIMCPWLHQGENPGLLTLTAMCLGPGEGGEGALGGHERTV